MSWGERSCKEPCRCPEKCTMSHCNVDCEEYVWDGVTKPDSIPRKEMVFEREYQGEFTKKPHYSNYVRKSDTTGPDFNKEFVRPPSRNQPCPCGSGKKYKHCCARRKT